MIIDYLTELDSIYLAELKTITDQVTLDKFINKWRQVFFEIPQKIDYSLIEEARPQLPFMSEQKEFEKFQPILDLYLPKSLLLCMFMAKEYQCPIGVSYLQYINKPEPLIIQE